MRVRLPLGRSLFFASSFLFALAALLPLRLALDWIAPADGAFAAREAQGSVWLGSVSEARLGMIPLGDLQAQLRTLPLFLARARIDLERRAEDAPLKGSATFSRHGLSLDDWEGRLDAAALFGPLPVGALELDDVSARYANGLCAQADGRVEAAVAGEVAGLSLPGGLSGNARCEGGAVLLPLASRSGMERLDLHLFGDGRYRMSLSIRPTNPALQARLAAAGFTAQPNGSYGLSREGAFQP